MAKDTKLSKNDTKTSSGALNRRPTPKSGKSQSYGAKAMTGKTKTYVG